jgi:hypothetical protein
MNAPFQNVGDAGRDVSNLYRLLVELLHRSGHDYLIWPIIIGTVIGGVCSIPAVVVGTRKNLQMGPIFWINVVAGGIAGIGLSVPIGIGALIYALRADSRDAAPGLPAPGQESDNRIPLGPFLIPLGLLVLCLVVLPNTCTSSVTVALPDDRSWLSKLTGEAAPTTTEEVTNWLIVILVTVVVCIAGFLIGCLIEEVKRPRK